MATFKGKTSVSGIIMLFIFGVVFFIWGKTNNSEIQWMHENGIKVTGTVVDAYPVGRIQTNYVVNFTTFKGIDITTELDWTADVQVGDKVDLIYSSGDPSVVMLESTDAESYLFVIANILSLVGLAGLIFRIPHIK